MSLVTTLYVAVPLVTAAVAAGLAYWVLTRHGEVSGSRWFVFSLFCSITWMLAHTAHVLVRDVGLQTVAMTVATKFAVASFLANIVFASLYTRTDFHRRPVVAIPLVGAALSLLFPTWIEPFQSIYYAEFVSVTEPFHFIRPEPGLGYAVVGSTVCILGGYALYQLIRYTLGTTRRSDLQLVLLVVGSISVMLAIALGNAGAFPVEGAINAPFGALPYAVLVSLALFRFRLFDIRPVARNAVVENLRDPVFVLDSDRRVVDYNPPAASLVSSDGNHVGRPFETVAPPIETALDFATDVDEEGTQLTLTCGGEPRHFSATVSRVSGDHRVDADWYSVLLRDVSDLERSRWQLATQNERLDQVASTISHDLRNPIQVADGRTEVLRDAIGECDLDPDREQLVSEQIESIDGATDRMAEIIDDVLVIAREGQTVEETEPVRLADVADDAWANVETDEATLSVVADTRIQADRSKFLSILENLFRNAAEHGSRDSALLTVEVGPVEDGFYIADDGPGVPPEHQDSIFEYGYTTAASGTGLGLSIVRTMAESHGWTVELDEDATGARFVFSMVGARATADGEQVETVSTS